MHGDSKVWGDCYAEEALISLPYEKFNARESDAHFIFPNATHEVSRIAPLAITFAVPRGPLDLHCARPINPPLSVTDCLQPVTNKHGSRSSRILYKITIAGSIAMLK